MAVQKSLGTAGLWISPSTLQAPVGAYILADNIVINSPGVAESRRGYAWFPYELSSVETTFPKASFSFRGTLLVQHREDLSYNSGAAFVDYAGNNVPAAPQSLRMKGEEMALSFYYTSSEGIKGIDTPVGGIPILAGEQRGPTPTSILNATDLTGTPGEGWFAADSQTAYVGTFFRVDANDIPHEGTPSNPVFVQNPAGLSVPAGGAESVTFDVTVTYPDHGFTDGLQVDAQFNIDDAPKFLSGTYTVSGATTDTFILVGAGAGTGPDSNTKVATISPGPLNVQVYVQLPDEAAAGDTVLIYRAKQSVGAGVPPRPQYYLDKEYVLEAADITAQYFTYTDLTPDDLLQDPLYTNTDDGEPPDSSLQNDNDIPPYCRDLAQFDQRLWGANYVDPYTLSFSLLATGAPNGLVAGDYIIIGEVELFNTIYLGVAEGATPGLNEFRVYTSYDAATNVAKTAQELALAVTTSGNYVQVYYTSGLDDLPGQLLARSSVPFGIVVTRPSAWNPIFTTTVDDAVMAPATAATNGLWFSKQNQPEAVPLLNRISVGPRNCSILRIRALRDKLFVFTDIAGTYVVSNSYPYQVTSLSATATLVAPDTLVNFDDAIYCLTTQGVVRFNEAGPTIISVPIESEIKALYGVGLPVLKVQAFAVGYESYRKYILAMPTTIEDDHDTEAWAYDVVTKAWTRWTKPMDSGVVIPQTDLLYITTPESTKVSYERKNFDRTDYADEDWQVTITAATGGVVSLTSTIEPTAGDLLYQSPILRSLIGSVESTGINTYDVVVNDTIDWTIAAATCYPGIQNTVLNTPLFASGPEERKNFREVTYHFRTPGFSLGKGLFAGDTNPYIEQIDFSLGGFGAVGWGLFGWEQPSRPVNKRIAIPTNARRVSYLSVGFALREAQAQWQLMGVSPVYENMSERNTR